MPRPPLPFRERMRHRAMMANPGAWPCWPLLPVKRYTDDNFMQAGLLAGIADPRKNNVYLSNLFAVGPQPLGEQLDGLPRIEYGSIDAMLDDGWEVD